MNTPPVVNPPGQLTCFLTVFFDALVFLEPGLGFLRPAECRRDDRGRTQRTAA